MDLRQLVKDENAVSPVIGVILMVAITVILAAVIATFVLGLGDSVQNTAPQASFSTDYDESNTDELTITHDGGDSIRASNLYIRGDFGSNGSPDTSGQTWTDYGGTATSSGGASKVVAGNTVSVSVGDDHTINIVFDDGQGSSATLAKSSGPQA